MCTTCQLAKQLLNENTLQILVVFVDYIDVQHGMCTPKGANGDNVSCRQAMSWIWQSTFSLAS